uniref:Uncharacterized protein n=1 Tax=Romanomermis culicivorax TaxID=13658 RepID=A0A915L5G6_ROMCU
MIAACLIMSPKSPAIFVTKRFLTRGSFRKKGLDFLKDWKSKLLEKEIREEQALIKASKKFYQRDNLDPKKWSLIHIERYGGLMAGMTAFLYVYFGLLTAGYVYVYFKRQRPSIFHILVLLENLPIWPDKILVYGSLILAYIYNSVRRRFVVRIYRCLETGRVPRYCLITNKWNMRPLKTGFTTKSDPSAVFGKESTKIYMYNYWRKYLMGNLAANGKKYIKETYGPRHIQAVKKVDQCRKIDWRSHHAGSENGDD